MAVITLTRITVDPADAAELVVAHSALVDSQRSAGVTAAQLGKLDDASWLAVWHWESHDKLAAARANPPAEAAIAFGLAKDRATVEDVDVVDEV